MGVHSKHLLAADVTLSILKSRNIHLLDSLDLLSGDEGRTISVEPESNGSTQYFKVCAMDGSVYIRSPQVIGQPLRPQVRHPFPTFANTPPKQGATSKDKLKRKVPSTPTVHDIDQYQEQDRFEGGYNMYKDDNGCSCTIV